MDEDKATILVVDDDPKLRELLARYLGEQGYSVVAVGDAPALDAYLAGHRPDLLILDLMLPGEDGLSIARRLRGAAGFPIIMLSARGEDIDRIVGLEVGADDYLPKPFNPRELLARIRAVLRRQAVPAADPAVALAFGDFRVDLATRRLLRGQSEVELTAGDFALLEVLVQHANRVLTRDQLVDLIKGYDRSPFDRSIDVRVTRLRRKIEHDASHPVFLRTVWGKGYMFTPGGDKAPG